MAMLDICCGDGWFTAAAATLTGAPLAGLDLDPAMLAEAETMCKEANVTFIEGDAMALGTLTPGPFDFVLIANTFHGVADQPALAATVASVLNPGGRFVIVGWHKRPREDTSVLGAPRGPAQISRMSPGETARAVEAGGLMLTQIVDLPPYHYGAVFTADS